jgi:hypothetical protein
MYCSGDVGASAKKASPPTTTKKTKNKNSRGTQNVRYVGCVYRYRGKGTTSLLSSSILSLSLSLFRSFFAVNAAAAI